MTCNRRQLFRLGPPALAVALLLSAAAAAQNAAAQNAEKQNGGTQQKPTSATAADLPTLLEQLAKTDAEAWSQRGKAMEAAAAKARADGKTLADEARQKADAAKAEAGAQQLLMAEIDKLSAVRTAVSKLTFRDPAGAGETQQAPQGQLELALAALRELPESAWQARTAAMQQKVQAHQQAVTDLQAAHKQLLAAAAAKAAAAEALDAEFAKLEQLRQLIASLKLAEVAAGIEQPAATAEARTGSAAAKPAATKPAATKPAAEKPEPMKPDAKKPDPEKPDPEKTEPKEAPAKKPQPKKPVPAKPAADKATATAAATAAATAPVKAAAEAAPMAATQPAAAPSDDDLITYRDHVYPIFDENCITCHDAGDASGDLDLSSHTAVLQGGGSGRTLRPGDPDGSRLYLLVSHKEKPTMPPDEPRLDERTIATIRQWIADGAPKDLDEAKKLAAARRAASAKATAEAAAKSNEQAAAPSVVMPTNLPRVAKAYPERPGALRAVAASPTSPLLAVPGFHQVLLLHQDDLRELGVLPFAFGQVETLSFSADGTVLLAAGGTPGSSGGAVLFDVLTGSERGRFGEGRDATLAASVSARGELVAVGGTRRLVKVFRVDDGQELWQQKHDEWVTAISFSPDDRLLASADRSGNVQVREASNGREVHTLAAAEGLLADLAFSPDSGHLATAGGDRSVCLFRMRDGRRIFRQQRHGDAALCIAWRTATRLISGSADGQLLHWKTDGNREAPLPKLGEWAYDVAASADGARVFAADWQGRLTTVDVASRKVLGTFTPLEITQ